MMKTLSKCCYIEYGAGNQFIAKILTYSCHCPTLSSSPHRLLTSLSTILPFYSPAVVVYNDMLVFVHPVSLLLPNNSIFNNEYAFINFQPRPNRSKERRHTPATQIQKHVISDGADDVFQGGGEWYCLVEALEVVVNPIALPLRT